MPLIILSLLAFFFFLNEQATASPPKYGPNGGISTAIPSHLSPGVFFAFGDFDLWNSTPVPLRFARILPNGEVDPSMTWSLPKPDLISEDPDSGNLWYCRTGLGADANQVYFVGLTSATGQSLGKELQLPAPESYLGCRAILATHEAVFASAGNATFYVTKDLKNATVINLRLFNNNPVSILAPLNDGSKNNVYIQATFFKGNQIVIGIVKVHQDGKVDPSFLIEGGRDEAVVTTFDGKVRLYYSGAIYDDSGQRIAALDPYKLNEAKSSCKDFGVAAVGPTGRTAMIAITGGYDRNDCRRRLLGFSEVNLADGSLVGQRFQSVVSSRPITPYSSLVPLNLSKGIYGIFTAGTARPTWPAVSVVYPDRLNNDWQINEGIWSANTRQNWLPPTIDGSIPSSFFLNAHGFDGSVSDGMPRFSIQANNKMLGNTGLDFGDYDMENVFEGGHLPLKLRDHNLLWVGKRESFLSVDGKSLSLLKNIANSCSRGPIFEISAEAYPLCFTEGLEHVTRLDFLTGAQSSPYTGVRGDAYKVFPAENNTLIIYGSASPCPHEKSGCTIVEVMQLFKFDVAKNTLDPSFQAIGYKIDSWGDPKSGYKITAVSPDPSQPGGFVISGIYFDKKSAKTFLGRIDKHGAKSESFWFEDVMDRSPTAVLALKDGRIYVGGAISTYMGQTVQGVFLVNRDGKLDTGFHLSEGIRRSPVEALSYPGTITAMYSIPASPGDALVFGEFSSIGRVTVQNVARISVSGEVLPLFTDQ